MRKFLIAASLLLSSIAMADVSDMGTKQSVEPAKLMSVDSTYAQVRVCRAITYCPNLGTNIFCYAYGAGCTWRVVPGVAVHCEGYDAYGDWQTFDASCY